MWSCTENVYTLLYFRSHSVFFHLVAGGKPQTYLKLWEANISLSDPAATLHQATREAGSPPGRVRPSPTLASGFISTFVIAQEGQS